jgi:hypothetical protein
MWWHKKHLRYPSREYFLYQLFHQLNHLAELLSLALRLLCQSAQNRFPRITVETVSKEITRRKIVMENTAPNLSG